MKWVNDTLLEFGRQLGLTDLKFGDHGVAQLDFQSGAVLAVEPVSRGDIDEVLVYLSRPVGFDGARLMRQALAKAHFKEAGAQDIQVATRGQGPDLVLFALVRMPARDFTLQALVNSFDSLNRWHDSLSA
jgi:type III secretion system chaperone SycN